MAKRATFQDTQTLRRARAARRKTTPEAQAPAPTTAIPGYRIQPLLPIGLVFADGTCTAARFLNWSRVEAVVEFGVERKPLTVVLDIRQALAADIIERVEEGCRCEVCGGRTDDPAGIHGRR